MATDDDFWLLIHDLAMGVDSDHEPWEGKAKILAGYFRKYPPVARAQLLKDFRLVLGILGEIEPLIGPRTDGEELAELVQGDGGPSR